MNCKNLSHSLRLRTVHAAPIAATLLLACTLSACGGDGNNVMPNPATSTSADTAVKAEMRCAP